MQFGMVGRAGPGMFSGANDLNEIRTGSFPSEARNAHGVSKLVNFDK